MGTVTAGPRHVDPAPGPAVPRGGLRVLTGVGRGAAWDLPGTGHPHGGAARGRRRGPGPHGREQVRAVPLRTGRTAPRRTVTAHHRGAVFLGREGLAPWLITEEGRRLVAAAFSTALSEVAGTASQTAST